MKIASHILIVACMSTGMASAQALADADSAAGSDAESTTPLAEIASISLKAPKGGPDADAISHTDVRLEFGAAVPQETGFLVFQDVSAAASSGMNEDSKAFAFDVSSTASFTPRAGVAGIQRGLAPGEAWLLSSFTPRSANAHLSLSYGSETAEDARNRLDIELSSSINVVPVDIPGVVNNASLLEAFARQEYNLGLKIGYQGFNLGASLKREYGEFSDGYEGFDVGLSYRAKSWSTSLSVGEYRRTYDNILGEVSDPDNSYTAFELGASYNLSRAFRLTGGFRHFEYGADFALEQEGVARSQIFYLGTRLNF